MKVGCRVSLFGNRTPRNSWRRSISFGRWHERRQRQTLMSCRFSVAIVPRRKRRLPSSNDQLDVFSLESPGHPHCPRQLFFVFLQFGNSRIQWQSVSFPLCSPEQLALYSFDKYLNELCVNSKINCYSTTHTRVYLLFTDGVRTNERGEQLTLTIGWKCPGLFVHANNTYTLVAIQTAAG